MANLRSTTALAVLLASVLAQQQREPLIPKGMPKKWVGKYKEDQFEAVVPGWMVRVHQQDLTAHRRFRVSTPPTRARAPPQAHRHDQREKSEDEMKEFEELQISLDDKIHKYAAVYPDVPGFVMLNIKERGAWLANYREQKRHEVELLSMSDMEREEAFER